MPAYDSKKPQQSRINFFYLAGRTTNLFEHEPLNAFNSIDTVILEPEESLEEYFWEEPHAVSPWNSYWTEAAIYGGGLQMNDPVFKDSWTKYYGLHVDCEEEEICYCEQNCGGTHITKGRAVTYSEAISERVSVSQYNSWIDYEFRKTQKGKEIEVVYPAFVLTTPDNEATFLQIDKVSTHRIAYVQSLPRSRSRRSNQVDTGEYRLNLLLFQTRQTPLPHPSSIPTSPERCQEDLQEWPAT
jgi:hypothetical protein